MAKKKKLTEEQEKEIKLLRASNEMYERTKEEARMRGKTDTVTRLENAQKEVSEQIKLLNKGIDIPSMEISDDEITDNENVKNEGYGESIFDILDREKNNVKAQPIEKTVVNEPIEPTNHNNVDTSTYYNNVDSNAQYDIVPLPSNGECYENKIDRVPVGFLTAYDENFITSPNLYRDGMVIDFLLRNKILNKDINPDNLVSGDADAIVLFLRATSYGVDFPIIVRDPESGVNIESTVDLSTIKAKPFNLKADENGHFSFVLPRSNVEVKFKYLTRKEERDLDLLNKMEDEGIKANTIDSANKTIKTALETADGVLLPNERASLAETTKLIDRWAEGIRNANKNTFNKSVTNRMEMQIVAINGNYDREYIRKAIMNMPAYESLALRRFIIQNEPGLDFEVEVKRPENLGGGSFKTFLEWDDSVFLNISQL